MTAQAVGSNHAATWVDLSILPPDLDPYAAKIPKLGLTKAQWLAIRRTGIGSSDIATVLGENPFKTPFALYQEKIGEWEPDDLSDNEAVEVGNDLEEYCGRKLTERTGRKVRRDNFVRRCVEHPFLLANVDFDVVAEDGAEPEIAECKTSLGRAALGDMWGDGAEDVPSAYLLQATEQLVVKRRSIAWMPALLTGPRVKIYRIEFRQALADVIIEGAAEFFRRLVERDAPPVTSLADAKRAYPQSRAIEVQASTEVAELVTQLRALKADEKSHAAQIAELQGKIAGYMADADTLMLGRQRLLTYKTVERNGYTVAPSSSRQFRIDSQKAE